MGSYKEDGGAAAAYRYKRFRSILKTWISCLGSFTVSILGGVTLTCWELRYHRSNSQLWMVPFGLILFATPAIVWLSVVISNILSSKEDEGPDVDQLPAPASPE